jgi:hypothetical protein
MERLIVQGGIVVLLLLVAVQAHARFGYEMSLSRLQTRLNNDDDGSEAGAPLLVADLPKLIVGFPSRSEDQERQWKAVTYTWHGLGKSYSIRMPYDSSEKEAVVLSLETADPPPIPEVVITETDENDPTVAGNPALSGMAPSGGHAGAGGGEGGGEGGGGQRRNIMDNDADGDGRISLEEAPERLKDSFADFDSDGDGYLDADEIAEMQRQFAARRAAAGPGGPGGGRPQRPDAEAPAADAPDAPADAAAPAQQQPDSEN